MTEEREYDRGSSRGGGGGGRPPIITPPPPGSRGGGSRGFWGWDGRWRRVAVVVLVLVLGYALYLWEVRRVVVPQNHVLVLLKKNGSRSLPGDQIIIPRAPAAGTPEYDAWDKQYGDCNGILEQVYPEGTYFGFSPFDYERNVIDISGTAIVPSGKVGVVVKKFGRTPLDVDAGQVLADPKRDQRGP